MGSVGRRAVFSGPFGMFVFDILQIPGEGIQICKECKAPPPRTMGLPVAEGWFLFRRRMEFEEQFLFTPEERATYTLWKGDWLWW